MHTCRVGTPVRFGMGCGHVLCVLVEEVGAGGGWQVVTFKFHHRGDLGAAYCLVVGISPSFQPASTVPHSGSMPIGPVMCVEKASDPLLECISRGNFVL